MPTISKKGQMMPQSPIRKLVPYAENAAKEGKTIYYLNIGQPDIKTPQMALDAVKVNSLEILAYTRSEGSDEYRTKIANYYKQHDIRVTKDDIIVTTGGSEALLFAFVLSWILMMKLLFLNHFTPITMGFQRLQMCV